MGTRTEIFDAVKEARGGRPWTKDDIALLDAALDNLGVPREGATSLSPSDACFSIIKQFEGCRLTAYPDPGSGGDPWTIGWGSTGDDIRRGVVWTQQQADQRLAKDVQEFGEKIAKLVDGVATSQQELDAMTSFAYNVGLGAFENSTLLKKHREGDKAGAAAEFGRWTKASGKVLAGLVKRRAAEADLYRGRV